MSVPSSFFGQEYKDILAQCGSSELKIYGRVEEVIDGNLSFRVKWDIDGEVSAMNINKVSLEPKSTPTQTVPEVSDVSESDEASNAPPTSRLLVGQKAVMEAKLVSSKVGSLVHNRPIKDGEAKFLITEVLDMWLDFDGDVHCPGSYVVWRTEDSRLIRKKKNTPGRNFRKNRERIADEMSNESEDEESEVEYEPESEECEEGKKNKRKKITNRKSVRQKKAKETEDEETEVESERESEECEEGKKTKRKKITNRKSGCQKKAKETEDEPDKVQGGRKKAKERKARKAKIVLGKKAADRTLKKNQNKVVEDENVLDFEEENGSGNEDSPKEKKSKEEKKIWKVGRRRIDPRSSLSHHGPKMIDPSSALWGEESYMQYFMAFLPIKYFEEVMLPATNTKAMEHGHDIFTFEELMRVLGCLYMMEVVRLPERRMYWRTDDAGFFPGLNFGRSIPLHRFETFLNLWEFSHAKESDKQVLEFIDHVNEHLKGVMRAGSVLCIDESMLKSFHRGLNGKMKIKRKPRPIGNEFKSVSDAATHVVLHLELHESKEDMADKEFVEQFGATTACTLRLTEYWKGTCQYFWERNIII